MMGEWRKLLISSPVAKLKWHKEGSIVFLRLRAMNRMRY